MHTYTHTHIHTYTHTHIHTYTHTHTHTHARAHARAHAHTRAHAHAHAHAHTHTHNHTTYQLGGTEVPTATQEKYLGIIVTENMKVSEQCANVTNTANKVLVIIKRSYDDKSIANLLPLYKAFVRPHIEYCAQAWRPYYQKDVDNLEKIQRRATRTMEEVRGMDYEQRLRQTSLVTLEARRTRADIIEVFKIMKGLEGLKREAFLRWK